MDSLRLQDEEEDARRCRDVCMSLSIDRAVEPPQTRSPPTQIRSDKEPGRRRDNGRGRRVRGRGLRREEEEETGGRSRQEEEDEEREGKRRRRRQEEERGGGCRE